jgi:tetratricopeptide (TPR) repeat protein
VAWPRRYYEPRAQEFLSRREYMETDIESLIREGRWNAARRAITIALRSKPTSHWLIARLGLTYYEQRQYSRGLKFTTRALELSPRCPLALWDYAGTLQMLARDAEAIAIYRRLIQRGPVRIAKDPCGERLSRSRGLVADCHLRLSDSLHSLGDEVGAERHFVKHLDMRGPGCQSIYPLKEIAVRHPALQRLHRPKSADAQLRRRRGPRPE